MELLKHNTDNTGAENHIPEMIGLRRSRRITQENLLYGRNSPFISYTSLAELFPSANEKKRTRHPKTKQSGPQYQNKRKISEIGEETERITKKDKGKKSNSLKCLSLEMERAEEVYLGRRNGAAAVGTARNDPKLSGFNHETESGQEQTFENSDTQFAHTQISITEEEVEVMNPEVYNSFLGENSHSPSNLLSSIQDDVEPSIVASDYKNFRIVFDGIDLTSAIKPERTRLSYFIICHARKSYLHTRLIDGIDINHAIFAISQTAKISFAIKKCNMLTTEKEIVYWRKTLESFLELGMDVGFILARVNRLLKLKMAMDNKKASAKEEKLEEKMRAFKLETKKMREEKRKIKDEREVTRQQVEELEDVFLSEANAPW